jgi:DNA-binding NarL/FixJ family response regulator
MTCIPQTSTRVLIHCCNRLLRDSIARILAKKTRYEVNVIQSLTSLEEIGNSSSDVLVLDSLEFILGRRAAWFEDAGGGRALNIVLVAMKDDQDNFLAALRRGARGYVLQEASAADVVSAVRAVADGQAVCPPHYTRLLFDCVMKHLEELPNSGNRARWALTRREQQLIPLIGRGLRNKEIASQFGLSEQTIKNHIHRILRKVGVSDRIGIYEAWQDQLVSSSTKDIGYSS